VKSSNQRNHCSDNAPVKKRHPPIITAGVVFINMQPNLSYFKSNIATYKIIVMKKILFLLLPVSVFIALSASGTGNDNELKKSMDNMLKWEEQFGFSGSVLVMKDGKVILQKGYGFADRRNHFYNSPKTAFFIASVTKPVTALAVMKLVEEKRIGLKDPITKYFPNVPDNKKDITIEMLLAHTSGMKQTYSCDNISDRDKAIETILAKTPMLSSAGTSYNYSGDNYSLLAALVEIVTNSPFEQFVTESVFTPAGINTPAFAGNLSMLKYDDIASPSNSSNFKSLRHLKSTWGNKGRSGMILSVEDLYKIDAALEAGKILNRSTLQDVLSSKTKVINGSSYGYGFELLSSIQGTKAFGHSGDDDALGHNMMYLNFPEEKIKIFVGSNSGLYSNTSWSTVITSLIRRMLFPSDYTYTPNRIFHQEFSKQPVEKLERLEGVYQLGNIDYHVWLKDEQQLVMCPVGKEVASFFGYPEAYSTKNELSQSVLEETSQKKYEALRLHTRDQESFDRLKKMFDGFWQSLEKNNGKLDRIEILGTANIWAGNPQGDIATWFRLVYKERSRLYRLEWDEGDKLAGLGGNRVPYPMMFTLNAIARNEFIGFDPANGKTLAVNFLKDDKDNKSILELSIADNKPLLLHNTGDITLLPKRSAAELLYNIMINQGITAATDRVSNIKESKSTRFYVEEDDLNGFGYKLLKENKTAEAIAMFTIITKEFPESSNAFDSLGDGYMKAGDKAAALKSYSRAVELDPKNEHSKKMVKELSN
jgi:CubicO group peptidase (beta-lactamase class C family)/tetratricopeptide (TPR) repeat protein